jgi:hypothetical protein
MDSVLEDGNKLKPFIFPISLPYFVYYLVNFDTGGTK